MGAPNPIEPTSQVWQWKEAFNFVGVIGFVLFLCSFTTLLLFTPTFACLRTEETVKPMPVKDKTGMLWFWLSLLAGGDGRTGRLRRGMASGGNGHSSGAGLGPG